MKLWHLASLAAVVVGAPTASAYHPLMQHVHQHKHHPNVIVVPGVLTTPQVVTQRFSVQSFSTPVVTQSYSLQPSQSFTFPSSGTAGASSADAQAINTLLIGSLIKTVLDGTTGQRSSDLSRRVRDLESRVDALEKSGPNASPKCNEEQKKRDEVGIKQGDPLAVAQSATDLQTLLKSLSSIDEQRDVANFHAQRILKGLELRQTQTADDIRALKEYLNPPAPKKPGS